MGNFDKFKTSLQNNIANMTKEYSTLFLTGVERDALWDTYLDSFPEGTNNIYKERREFDCNHCKQFIRPYANVVAIKNNQLVSIWDIDGLEYPFDMVAKRLSEFVKSAPIVNVFVSHESNLGVDKSRQLCTDGSVKKWEHFYAKLPKTHVTSSSKSVEAIQGRYRDSKNVFKRSMEELTLDAGQTILELINQNSLYRGEEFKTSIKQFIEFKTKFDKLSNEKDNWCWVNSINNHISKIRNTAIGTLLIDLSEGVDLNLAVTKFERVMAPTNYKRPNSVFTTRMIEDAQKKIEELGFSDSLARRYATLEDITVNNVLFVNRDAKKKLGGSVFDDLKDDVHDVSVSKKFTKIEEVHIEDFILNILPDVKNIELMFESKHQHNLMSLVAPQNISAPSMLKWGNNFSWAYNGDIADSMKQNVKNAGGDVDGVLRFSIQWNDGDNNQNDFDAHCIEPNGNRIYFGNKRNPYTTGKLDVDIICPSSDVAVENITWNNINKMEDGKYTFFVNNYSHRGGITGFTAEIEYDGQIYSYVYNKELRQGENVIVAEITFNKRDGIKFIKSLDSSTNSKEIWGIKTNKFSKVSVSMFSPNHWDEQTVGNKHYLFFLEGCENPTQPRGFFNEFLKEDLMAHKHVFEALGSKMRVEMCENQLSGLGFSSTQRNDIVAKLDGKFTRTIKIVF